MPPIQWETATATTIVTDTSMTVAITGLRPLMLLTILRVTFVTFEELFDGTLDKWVMKTRSIFSVHIYRTGKSAIGRLYGIHRFWGSFHF